MTFLSVEEAMRHHRRMMQNHEPVLRVDKVDSEIRDWFIASFGQYIWLDECPLLCAAKVLTKQSVDHAVQSVADDDARAINARVDGLVDPPTEKGRAVL